MGEEIKKSKKSLLDVASKVVDTEKKTSTKKTTTAKVATKTEAKTSAEKDTTAKTTKVAAKTNTKATTKTASKTVAAAKVEKVETKPAAKAKSKAASKVENSSVTYDEDSIIHLEGLEHIRLRPGMYIGSLGDGSNENDGIYILLKEGIDNAIDEFTHGHGNRIDIEIKDGRVKIRDYGRGIPLGKLEDCVSNVNTGAKYNNSVFKQSIGMNGVGIKATNALSSYFRAASVRDGKMAVVEFERGEKKSSNVGNAKPDVDPVGACVGMNGARVNAIVSELRGEKIDIITWNENPAMLIENALSPAKVISVIADADEKSAKVVVPDYQLSLAIGKEGQNARLAARLTGYKIDIKSETQAKDAPGFRYEDYMDEFDDEEYDGEYEGEYEE